MTLKAKVFGFF